MRPLLDSIYGSESESTLVDFIADLALPPDHQSPFSENRGYDVRGVTLPFLKSRHDVYDLTGYLFNFIASEPLRLSSAISEFIDRNIGDDRIDVAEKIRIVSGVKEMGAALDAYVKVFARDRPWLIMGSSINVTRIWREKGTDEVVCEPLSRNILSGEVKNRLCSFVMAETDRGDINVSREAMVSLSDGVYSYDQVSGREVRQDYLISIANMFAYNHEISPIKSSVVLDRLIASSGELLAKVYDVAVLMNELGILEDPDGIYIQKIIVRKGVNAEDSPNALIKIGEWS